MRLLVIHGYVAEDSFMALLSHNIFPHLEVVRIKSEQLRISETKLRLKFRLKHLKKLDCTGCVVKRCEMLGDNPEEEEQGLSYREVKKRALGRNY